MSHVHSHKFCSVLYGRHLLPFTLATVLRCCCLLPSAVLSVCRKWPTVKVTEAAHIWTDWLTEHLTFHSIWQRTKIPPVVLCVCSPTAPKLCLPVCTWISAGGQCTRPDTISAWVYLPLTLDLMRTTICQFCQSTCVCVWTTTVTFFFYILSFFTQFSSRISCCWMSRENESRLVRE